MESLTTLMNEMFRETGFVLYLTTGYLLLDFSSAGYQKSSFVLIENYDYKHYPPRPASFFVGLWRDSGVAGDDSTSGITSQ